MEQSPERLKNSSEELENIYNDFLSTPNPDDPDFEDENIAFNYIAKLDRSKAYKILHYLDELGIDRNFIRRITVDHQLEWINPDVGGYYSLESKFVSLNAAILRHGSVNMIVHIICHEAIHAGVLKDLEGVRVKDEALVEFITTQKIKKLFSGRVDFKSGYTKIVNILEELLGVQTGQIDIENIIAQINSSNIEMLDNFLEIIVLNPLVATFNPKYLSYFEIEDELNKKWVSILKLFPRLINDIDSPFKSPHEKALMNVNNYKFENLLFRAAQNIFETPLLLIQVLQKVYKQLGKYIQNETDLKEAMYDLGYGYLVDYANEFNISLLTYLYIEV